MYRPEPSRRGFTLIELLIVLTVVSILCSIAFPSYAAHVLRTRRLEGKLALLQVMQAQESVYSRSNRYLAFSADANAGAGSGGDAGSAAVRWWSGASATASAYELHAQPCANADLSQCIEIVATPGTDKVDGRFRDAECGALSLLSTGEQRAATGRSACWQ
ncbi:MAG: pilus assembly protein PilE [Massilia sp.]|nr:pilus assembly protein PilE [Massilia sp.]